MNKIGYYNETEEDVLEFKKVKKVIKKAIEMEELDNLEFNIILVDNDYIHELNKNYRGIDRPTDVITFALEDYEDFKDIDTRVLGDVYISIDKARSQAIEYGHSLKRELCFLAVHGFLHLLGYDHMKKEDEEVMFHRQELILDACEIKKD